MVFGVIYEYVDKATGESAYVGKASGLYGHKKTLRTVHLRHMQGHSPIPAERAIITRRECAGSDKFCRNLLDDDAICRSQNVSQ